MGGVLYAQNPISPMGVYIADPSARVAPDGTGAMQACRNQASLAMVPLFHPWTGWYRQYRPCPSATRGESLRHQEPSSPRQALRWLKKKNGSHFIEVSWLPFITLFKVKYQIPQGVTFEKNFQHYTLSTNYPIPTEAQQETQVIENPLPAFLFPNRGTGIKTKCV